MIVFIVIYYPCQLRLVDSQPLDNVMTSLYHQQINLLIAVWHFKYNPLAMPRLKNYRHFGPRPQLQIAKLRKSQSWRDVPNDFADITIFRYLDLDLEIAVYSDACTNSQYHSSPEHRWLCRINYKSLCGKFSASLWSLCFTYCTFLVFFIVSERFQRVLIGCALLWHRLTCEPGLHPPESLGQQVTSASGRVS